jgi:alkylation response protein AidB-like acyl-CoA dehydrogenase
MDYKRHGEYLVIRKFPRLTVLTVDVVGRLVSSLVSSRTWYLSTSLSFTVGCRTPDGFTVLLVERSEGLETKPIKTSYSPAAGTSYVTFDNVRVPVANTLGKVGQGMFVMLSNFNHERWTICVTAASGQRTIVEECLK